MQSYAKRIESITLKFLNWMDFMCDDGKVWHGQALLSQQEWDYVDIFEGQRRCHIKVAITLSSYFYQLPNGLWRQSVEGCD